MKSPVAAYLVPFVLGILLQDCLPSLSLCLPLLCLSLPLLVLVLCWRRMSRRLMLPLLFLSVMSLGFSLSAVRSPGFRSDHYSHFVSPSDAPVWLYVRLSEMPHAGSRSLKATADVLALSDGARSHATSGRIILFFNPSSRSDSLVLGDCLLLRGAPSLPSASTNPYQFDYRRYLRHRGILRQLYLSDASFRLVGHQSRGLVRWAAQLRARWIGVIRGAHLSPRQQALAEALVLGWRSDLDPATQRQFRDAGVTHLLCVSGLHVGIVAWLLALPFLLLGNSASARRLRGTIQLLGIWFFVLISGMAPSTLRAAWMFSFIVVGQNFFSRPPTVNAIASSALCLLLFRPGLLFDVGFQLSYSAVLGIATLHAPLCSLIPFPSLDDLSFRPFLYRCLSRSLHWLWSFVCLTTVAQLSTLPFTLFYFHQFPFYFLLSNLLVVPLAGLLLGSVVIMMLCAHFQWLFSIMAHLVSAQMTYMDAVTSWVSSLPHAMAQGLYFDLPMAILLFLVLVFLGRALLCRDLRYLLFSSLTLLLLSAHLCAISFLHQRQRQWIIYNANHHAALEFVIGPQSWLLSDSAVVNNPSLLSYQRSNYLLMRQIRHTEILPLGTSFSAGTLRANRHFFRFDTTTILLFDRSTTVNLSHLQRSQSQLSLPRFPEHINYLVLSSNPWVTVSQLQLFYDFDTLVLAPDNSPKFRHRWQSQADTLSVPLLDIPTQGALHRSN